MPSKSRNSSRNSSRKSTVSVKVDENEYGSVVMKTKAPSIQKPKPRADFQEPIPVSPNAAQPKPIQTPWEKAGVTEDEYIQYLQRSSKMIAEWQAERMEAAWQREYNSPAYWMSVIDQLSMEREAIQKKRAWSAEDVNRIESIDKEIKDLEDLLCEHYMNEEDRLEYEWD